MLGNTYRVTPKADFQYILPSSALITEQNKIRDFGYRRFWWRLAVTGWKFILVWIVCIVLGAAVGFAIGWGLWKLGLELLGSAIALIAAGIGGFLMLFAFISWSENRGY